MANTCALPCYLLSNKRRTLKIAPLLFISVSTSGKPIIRPQRMVILKAKGTAWLKRQEGPGRLTGSVKTKLKLNIIAIELNLIN